MTNNYFINHPMYRDTLITEDKATYFFHKYEKELNHILKPLDKNVNILEIGFWQWNFSFFCKKKWFVNYVWIDIDDTFINELRYKLRNYNFLKIDIINFLKENKWFDVIFMSHVFEHLDEKNANEAIKLLYSSLKKWWYFINYMPNADSYLNPSTLRYIDITHKTIYNKNSFEQLILTNWIVFSTIKHFNTLPAINPYIKFLFKIIHPIFLWLTKIYFYG